MRLLIAAFAFVAFPAIAHACFLEGEQKSGMNKICYYKCISGTKAITVGALDFCPLTIRE